jgi:hypothetical protein
MALAKFLSVASQVAGFGGQVANLPQETGAPSKLTLEGV